MLYNAHRAREHASDDLVIVEGFFNVMALYEQDRENTVALMGSSMSSEQEALIVNAVGPEGRVTLMFDDDEAGMKCTEDVLKRLSRYVYVKVMYL